MDDLEELDALLRRRDLLQDSLRYAAPELRERKLRELSRVMAGVVRLLDKINWELVPPAA